GRILNLDWRRLEYRERPLSADPSQRAGPPACSGEKAACARVLGFAEEGRGEVQDRVCTIYKRSRPGGGFERIWAPDDVAELVFLKQQVIDGPRTITVETKRMKLGPQPADQFEPPPGWKPRALKKK